MDFEDLKDMAGDPRFISGIYNYCDRWCERCALTSRCLNYAMQQKEDVDPAARDVRNEAFWQRLHSIFRQTLEMVAETAEEQGIEVDPAELEAIEEEERRKTEEIKRHELTQAARQYADRVDEWLEANDALFRDKGDQLSSALRMGLPGADPAAEAASLRDAIEVIRWYQYPIYVKLMRALHGIERERELKEVWDDEMDEFPSDSDGSAKVALIATDRSIGAWGTLRSCLADKRDSILDTLVHLDRLRRRTEQVFPRARAFIRPGFDEPVAPLDSGQD